MNDLNLGQENLEGPNVVGTRSNVLQIFNNRAHKLNVMYKFVEAFYTTSKRGTNDVQKEFVRQLLTSVEDTCSILSSDADG